MRVIMLCREHLDFFIPRARGWVRPYEEVYLKEYDTVPTARVNLQRYFDFYNNERIYQALDYRTPAAVHYAR